MSVDKKAVLLQGNHVML